MNAAKKKKEGSGLLLALFFAAELFFLSDMALARSSSNLPPLLAAVIFVSTLCVTLVLYRLDRRLISTLIGIFTAAVLLSAAVVGLLWKNMYTNGVYEDNDRGKAGVYAGREVMVIVPHEDDEINLCGGVIEEYVKYGSRVRVVYLTNGDMSVSADRRYAEAIKAMAVCGVPEEDLIFLGYGDSLFDDGTEIYFLEDDRIVESHAGKTQTYGTVTHRAYREGRDYTLKNMYEDLRDVILEYRPTVLFCCGYDEHADHRLCSLLFDRVMGEILQKHSDYKPDIFKGYAYSLTYYAEPDFYRVNLGSTKKSDSAEFMQEDNVNLWSDRLRFPVKASSLSRSVFSSGMYKALACYSSQETRKMADGIINGDRVFWQRETGSKLYYTDVEVTSGDGSVLNDFMLTDRRDPKLTVEPSQNVWIPYTWDIDKEVTFRFTEPTEICRIKLYDNPSLEDNILDAVITLDGGTELHTGPLPENGSPAEFEFGRRNMARFSVRIVESEGKRAGLSEVEAFDKPFSRDYKFVKLMTENGDFVYDYYIAPTGHESFRLYIRGASMDRLDLRVSCSGGTGCRAKLEDGRLNVICPEGESCVVTVASADGSTMDSVKIRNDHTGLIRFLQRLEQYARKEFREGVIRSNTWFLLRSARDLIFRIREK